MAAKKKVASSAQRRAYRSVTTKKQRKTERKAVGKGQFSKNVAASGSSIRQSRNAAGTNPNTGKPKTGKTAKTKAVSRIAANKGISRSAANKVRKSRK